MSKLFKVASYFQKKYSAGPYLNVGNVVYKGTGEEKYTVIMVELDPETNERKYIIKNKAGKEFNTDGGDLFKSPASEFTELLREVLDLEPYMNDRTKKAPNSYEERPDAVSSYDQHGNRMVHRKYNDDDDRE